MRTYRQVEPISRAQALVNLSGDDENMIRETLVRIAFHEPDAEWAQAKCVEFCAHPDDEVRGVAVTCLGHIARIHSTIDMGKVGPVLERLLSDPAISGRVEDALDDIRRFAQGK